MTDVKEPSPITLAKYGLTLDAWYDMLDSQGGVCPICKRIPSTGRMQIDHEHVRGWKKMPDDQRVLYTRGICCAYCNRYHLARGMSVERAENIAAYLTAYNDRLVRRAG